MEASRLTIRPKRCEVMANDSVPSGPRIQNNMLRL